MTDEDRQALVTHVNALLRRFDAVQVFVTRQEPDGTTFLHHGRGNWFARFGQVRLWLRRAEAADAAEAVRDDEREDWQRGDEDD